MSEILFYICHFVFSFTKVWFAFRVLATVLTPKRNQTVVSRVEAVTAVIIAVLEICNIINGGEEALFSNSVQVLCAIVLAFELIALYRVNWLDSFSMIYATWGMIQVVDFFVLTLTYRLLGMHSLNQRILLQIGWERGVYLLLFSAALVWLKKWIRIEKGLFSHTRRRYFWEIVLISVITYTMTYFQRIYSLYIDFTAASEQYAVNWGFFFMTVIIFACFIFIYVQRLKVQENDRLVQLKLTMLEQSYDQVVEMYKEKSRLLHDEKHHMRVLGEYLEENRAEDAAQYIGQVTEELEASGNRIWSGHSMLDMILNMKAQEAQRQNIKIDIAFDSMHSLKLKDTEICALFANLLDNAIEANQKIPEEERRWITMHGEKRGNLFIVNLSNAIGERVKRYGNQLLTSKADTSVHGFGMQSVQRIVDTYQGAMEITAQEDKFSLVLYLMGFEQESNRSRTRNTPFTDKI